MNLKVSYYDEFSCTANQCPMTCCMQWKIAVDETTYDQWDRYYFDGKKLKSYVKGKNASRIIRLNEHRYCPFLNKQKLCQLVVEHGDGILSHTCDTFPRQIQEFPNRTEYSLVACCPAVIDFMKNQEEYRLIEDAKDGSKQEDLQSDVLYVVRNLIMEIVKDTNYSVQMSIMMAFYVLLDIYNGSQTTGWQQLNPQDFSKDYDAQNLSELYNQIIQLDFPWRDTFEEDNELWLDMVENYRKEGLYEAQIEPISILAQEWCEAYDDQRISGDIKRFNEEMKPWNELLRRYVVSEIFSSMVIADSDLESMVVMMQWIAMEYVMIRHGLFLKWQQQENLSYEEIREHIVVVARMTGYDQDDIYEYMENSFQSIVWEWAYLALIIGL